MKILLTTHDLGLGGSEMTLVHEANGLAERGHEVYVVPMLERQRNDLAPLLKIPPDHFVPFHFRSHFDIQGYRKLIPWLREIHPDIVISGSLFSTTIFKFAKILLPYLRLMVRESNILIRHSRKSKLFDRLTRGRVERYFTNCEAIKHDLMQEIRVSEKKIAVIHNGIDPEHFAVQPIAHQGFTLLHVGSMSTKQKGQEYLIEAMRTLSPRMPDARVLFVGDGHRRSELQKLAADLPSIQFLGKQSPPFSEADIFVFPSLWEGMPNALLEAMAASIPVIATPVGGIPEVIQQDVSGLLVPPEDSAALATAIMKLYDDGEMRERIGRAGRAAVHTNEFTWQNHITCLEKLFSI